MKKFLNENKHKVAGIFILVLICFSLFTNTVNASFGYKFGAVSLTQAESGFKDLAECTISLTKDKKRLPGWTFTDCVEATDLAPIIPIRPVTNIDYPIPVAPRNSPTIDADGVYKLLAPIGKLTQINTSGGTCPGNPDITNGVACYLNIIFKIGIGLAGALAVVMIVVASIQYMGDESVFGKTEAKGKIFSAILGLIIALAAYAILNTINPDLTGSGGVTIDDVSFEIDGEPMISDDLVPSGAKTTKCPEGIDSGNKPPSCKTITQKVQAMLSKARTEGYNITGYGFRSKQRQEKLRSDNCGASNIYNKNATCQPPTALPGTSMHESGLAFDLQCDGKSIRTKDNRCFLWLKSNASKYGLYNLSSEPWHWSTTGH